ncbi:MAG: ABC transporter permease [Anaerolineae bacterium]
MLQQILSVVFLTGFLASTLRMAAPILIAALGEMFSERSGIMNLGIEGIMILGAFTGFTVAFHTGSLWLGFISGGLAGAILGLAMGILAVRYHANQIVAGLGIWIFCQGLSSFLNRRVFGIVEVRPTVSVFSPISVPLFSKIPILGHTIFNQNVIVYLTLLAVPLSAFILSKTSWGLNLDAVGEHPRAADAAGVSVDRVRYVGVTFGGLMAGFGGAYLSLALYGLYTDDLSTGLGWMAVAVVVFGKWRPWWITGGALIFGAANALQFRLQAMHFPLPYQFLLMIPSFVTLIVVILFVRGGEGPSALTVPYRRSEG